jgi:hypothetical protein
VLQIVEPLDELGVELGDSGGVGTFLIRGLDGFENGAENVEQLQQTCNDRLVGGELAVAQHAEEIFTGVGEFFEALESQEAGRAFDGVHRAEDIPEKFFILGALFEVGEAALHAVEAFLAFDEELAG